VITYFKPFSHNIFFSTYILKVGFFALLTKFLLYSWLDGTAALQLYICVSFLCMVQRDHFTLALGHTLRYLALFGHIWPVFRISWVCGFVDFGICGISASCRDKFIRSPKNKQNYRLSRILNSFLEDLQGGSGKLWLLMKRREGTQTPP
jgi:hypothetical protein